MKRAEAFFAYARERYEIMLRRRTGVPPPWTKDQILREYRFCCVHREDDRTTEWFRTHVRDPMSSKPEVLLATVVFRMFNRIESGEAIFCDDDLLGDASAFELFKMTGDVRPIKEALLRRLGRRGPFVTGSYIISTPPGKKKLDGVLWILSNFYKKSGWQEWVNNDPAANECSLEAAWEWLREQDYLGKFHSYEIVTDLRHTRLLESAPDVMTWANPGPGARRGLCRVWDESLEKRISREEQIGRMHMLLASAGSGRMWPKKWPQWEMREVEHTLCEFDKYCRVKLGQGRPRGVFRP